MNRFTIASMLVVASLCTAAHANIPFQQGFETDTTGWTAANTTTRVASGGGVLGLTASSGNYYAEVTNLRDNYGYGCGTGGSSYFGGKVSTYQGDFYQSIDVYINTAWSAGPLGGTPAFWIDMSPCNTSGASDYRAEKNFRFLVNGDNKVTVDGGTSPGLATITNSGWYTFEIQYLKGATPTDTVTCRMSVYDAASKVSLGTIDQPADFESLMPSSDLGGNGYVWMTVWQNGFANDIIAIDNVTSGLVPEPATMSLLGVGLLALLRRRRK